MVSGKYPPGDIGVIHGSHFHGNKRSSSLRCVMVEVAGTLGRGDKTTMERGAGVPSPGSTSRCANTAILCSPVLHDLGDLTQFAFYFCSG